MTKCQQQQINDFCQFVKLTKFAWKWEQKETKNQRTAEHKFWQCKIIQHLQPTEIWLFMLGTIFWLTKLRITKNFIFLSFLFFSFYFYLNNYIQSLEELQFSYCCCYECAFLCHVSEVQALFKGWTLSCCHKLFM